MYFNRNLKKVHFLLSILFIFLYSCSALFKAPTGYQSSTLGEVTPYTKLLKTLPEPKEKTVVAVYKFKDQTGQYKASENISNWSTAIPQGTTSILLKALEDSKWFTTIERENISDLLNERQIIKSTRQEYVALQNQTSAQKSSATPLPPLLFAGVIIEGGIISYDTNIMTGGAGARYFGIGASTQYRQDRISVYLRAVSTNNGKILKTIYTSKTILSQSLSGSFFRYVDPERLLEAEIGVTKNEPVHLAVKEAIEKAVFSLVLEGVKDGLWESENSNKKAIDSLIANQKTEEEINDNFRVDNRIMADKRGSFAIRGGLQSNTIKGDYVNAKSKVGFNIGAKLFISKSFNIDASWSDFYLENSEIFKRKFNSLDFNIEYILMPSDNISPYAYGGVGLIGSSYSYFNNIKTKVNAGVGVEYMPMPKFGLRLYGEYDFGMNDDWDNFVNGKRNDNLFRVGFSLNYYFGKPKN
ncbi:CsgG/HfaB family protein [Chryseobacterium sp. TY3]